MATTYYDAQDCYGLKSTANGLKILVQTGDGQGGGYLIFNGAELIGPNQPAKISDGSKVKEWITITVAIKDKLQETNWTSVSVVLQEDGQQQETFGPYKREVETHLDTVCYTIKIKVSK